MKGQTTTPWLSPYSLWTVCGIFNILQNLWTLTGCETGLTVLAWEVFVWEDLKTTCLSSICRWHYKGSTFYSVILTLFRPWVPIGTYIDFTLSNARRFYSSMGNPLDRKGLTASKTMSPFKTLCVAPTQVFIPQSPALKSDAEPTEPPAVLWILMQCCTSLAFRLTESWSLCGSIKSPLMMDIDLHRCCLYIK